MKGSCQYLGTGNKPILIFGAGQVAQVFREYIGPQWPFQCFVVDEQHTPPYPPGPLCRSERVLSTCLPSEHQFTVGMSFKGLNKPRAEKFEWMRGLGYEPLTFACGDVWIPNSAKIGAGSFIMDRNTIQTGVEIGENCILWSGNHIGHHTKIGNHVFIASHAVISGACEIGEYSFIGVNATIRDGVKIGKRNIIGAGALILQDTPDDAIYAAEATKMSKCPSYKIKF